MNRSPAAVRCAIASTVDLLATIAVSGPLRPVFAFIWVVLCLCAMGFEMAHRKRAGQPIRRQPPARNGRR